MRVRPTASPSRVRLGAPIFASDELLAEYEPPAAEPDDAAPEADAEGEPDLGASSLDAHRRGAEQLQRHLEQLRPEDFGKFTL